METVARQRGGRGHTICLLHVGGEAISSGSVGGGGFLQAVFI